MEDINFKIQEITTAPDYGEFVIEPLDPGYGHTMGNALRRVLYTSIRGAAVTSVRITGATHKFSTMPGLKENIVDLLLNVKELKKHLQLQIKKILYLKFNLGEVLYLFQNRRSRICR